MKCNQSRPGFELVSPCSFPTAITTTPRAPPDDDDGDIRKILTKNVLNLMIFFVENGTGYLRTSLERDCNYRIKIKLETVVEVGGKGPIFNGLMSRVFANGPVDWGLIPGEVVPKTQTLYLKPPCWTLSIIRYGSRVKWSNPEKGIEPSLTYLCSSYWKGSLRVTFDEGRYLSFLLNSLRNIMNSTIPQSRSMAK